MLPSTALGIAPEFDASVGWLNTTPTPLAALRGHPLLPLFWNAGSSHCHNATFAQPTGVAVVGEHAYVLDAASSALRQALMQYPTARAALVQAPGLWIADAGSHTVWRLDVDSGELRRLPIGE